MNIEKVDYSLNEKLTDFLRKWFLQYKSHKEIKNTYFERWLNNINYYNESKLNLITTTKKTLIIKKDYIDKKQKEKKGKLISLINKWSNINFSNKQIVRYCLNKWKNEKKQIFLSENFSNEINEMKDNEKGNYVINIKNNELIQIGNNELNEINQNFIFENNEIKNGESIIKNEIYCNSNFKQINSETQSENNKTNEDEDIKKREEKVLQLIKNRIQTFKSKKSSLKKYWDKWNEKNEIITQLKVKYKKRYKKILQIGKRYSNLNHKYILKEIVKNKNDIEKEKKMALYILKNYFDNIDSKKGLLKKCFKKWFGKPKYIQLNLNKKRTLKRFLIIRQVEEENDNDKDNVMNILRDNILRYYIEKNEDTNNIKLVKNVLLIWKSNINSMKGKIRNCLIKYLLILIKKNNDLIEKYFLKWIDNINKLKENEIKKKQILILNSIIRNINNKIKNIFKNEFLKWKTIIKSIIDFEKLKENRKNILIIIHRKKENKLSEIVKFYFKKWEEIIIKLIKEDKIEKIKNQRKKTLIHFHSKLEDRNKLKLKFYLIQWNNIIELLKQKFKLDRINALSKLFRIKLNQNKIILNIYLNQWKENLIKIKERELKKQISQYLQILISNKENKIKHFLFQNILILKSNIDKLKENEVIQEQVKLYFNKIILQRENKSKDLLYKNIKLWNSKVNELKENDIKLKKLNDKKNQILTFLISKKILQNNEKLKDFFNKIKSIILKKKIQEFIELKAKKIQVLLNLKNIIVKVNQLSFKKYFDKWKNIINQIKIQEIKNKKDSSLIIIKNKTNKIFAKYLIKWKLITEKLNEKSQKKVVIVKTKKSISYKTINSNLKNYFDIWKKQVNSIPYKIINFKNFNSKITKEINNKKRNSISPSKFKKEENYLNKTLLYKDKILNKNELINNSKTKQNFIPKPKAIKHFYKKKINNSHSKNTNRVSSVQIRQREKKNNLNNSSLFINNYPNNKFRNKISYLKENDIKNNSVIESYNTKTIANNIKNKGLKYRNFEYLKLNNEPEEKGTEDKIYLNKTHIISSKNEDLFEAKNNSINKNIIKSKINRKFEYDNKNNSQVIYYNRINNRNLKKKNNEKIKEDLYNKIIRLSNQNSKYLYGNLKLLNDNDIILKGYLNNLHFQNKNLAIYRIIMIYNIFHSKKIFNMELCFRKWKDICNIKISNVFNSLIFRNKYCNCYFLNFYNCYKCSFESKCYECKWKNIYRLLRNIIYIQNDLKIINPKKFYFQIWKFQISN